MKIHGNFNVLSVDLCLFAGKSNKKFTEMPDSQNFDRKSHEGDIGGLWTPQYRKKFGKYRAISQKKPRKIPQYPNTESKLDVIPKLLLCMLSLEQI